MKNETYEALRRDMESMPVFDTHEHLPPFESEWNPPDVLNEFLIHYTSSDFVNAGVPAEIMEKTVKNPSLSLSERWDILAPYWEFVRYTGYGRSLERSIQLIYGEKGLDRDTLPVLNEKMMAEVRQGGHFQKVLKEICRIRCSIIDWIPVGAAPCDSTFFRRALNIYPFVRWTNNNSLDDAGKLLGERPDHFVDYLSAVEKYVNTALDSGCVCLKCLLAYERPLSFREVSRSDAKLQFRKMVRNEEGAFANTRDFEDFMMHFLLDILESRSGILQIHTGLLEGYGNTLANSDPTLLNSLFLRYPHVRFDLFHMGWPYTGQAIALTKMCPNVWLDLCWAHIISPASARQALSEMLDTLPLNKILGFGGDYKLIDGVAGHLAIAKDNIAEVLAEKTDRKEFTCEQARWVAGRLLHDNAADLYGI